MRRFVIRGVRSVLCCTLLALSPAFAMDRYVAAGQSLQQTLNDALPGDTITLQAGATFTGSFVLPVKQGTGWITIQSSLMNALPQAGQRVDPSHAPLMPKLISPSNTPALATASGAHHYRIVGIELASAPGKYSYQVVALGSNETSTAQLPYAIELDRVYIHGDPFVGGKRGIALNSRDTKILNSYISDFKSTYQDAQAICGWNGSGPYQITNNYLEASGENIMFGGATPTIPNLVPSDIIISRNHLFKPLSWRPGDPTYAGTAWMVKNIFELKNARRVTLDGNILENSWGPLQFGTAVQLTVRTENGAVPWAVVEDVMVSNNIIKHVGFGVNIFGRDLNYDGAQRITIRNNVFEDLDGVKWGGKGRFVQVLNGCRTVVIEHNTVFQTGDAAVYFALGSTPGFVYRNNLSAGPLCGDSTGCGIPALTYWAPGSSVTNNVIAGVAAGSYPVLNYFPASVFDARFVDASSSLYSLAADSPYRGKASDGKDIGVDFAALTASASGSTPPPVEPPVTPPPPPPATTSTTTGTAAFLRTDTTTAGSWKGAYGADGFGISNHAASYPSYVTVTPTGTPFTWAATTSDTRALQKGLAGATGSIASCWYHWNIVGFNLAFNDQNTHQVAVYFLDWDGLNRSARVEVIDANNAVLDSRTISNFGAGQYLVWNLSGRVTIRVISTNLNNNITVSGIFFGGGATAARAVAPLFVGADTTTGGTWKGVYGAEGFNVINDGTSYPSYVTVTPPGRGTWSWNAATSDFRALQKTAATATDRIATCWYHWNALDIGLKFNDQNTHQVAIYLLDWDNMNRTAKVEVLDAANNNAVLDSRTVSSFGGGQYLVWNLKGNVIIRVTNTNLATNAVISGLFFR